MKPDSKKDDIGGASHAFLAVAPYTPDAYGGMRDADGDRVITCNDECPPCTLYKEKRVDDDAWFVCPKCGRLGQRMEEASHRQVLTANAKPTGPGEQAGFGREDGCHG